MRSKILAALIAACLLAPPQAASAAEATPADQISEFRLKHGEIRVTRDAVLDRIAADQAQAMAAKDELSHDVLGSFTRRVAPSHAGHAAENIAYGYDGFDKTLGQWINSPEHRKNLLLHNATKVGIASAKTASGKRTYWSMEIAGDYETKPLKVKDKDKIRSRPASPAVAQSKPGTRWGAKLPSKPGECHLNIKLLGLCI